MTDSVSQVSRKDLYTNLDSRVSYLVSFLDFNSNDIEALVGGAQYIAPLIPVLVDAVYQKLLQYDVTARAFITRSTSYEGPMDENLNLDSPQIKHRKMFLKGYLARLCKDPGSKEFWEYMDKVGMMHVGRGRKHPLHIEYIHVGALLGFVQDTLTQAVLSHSELPLDAKTAVLRAVGKILWIQNDLFAKWYVRDGEEFQNGEEVTDSKKENEG